jgi:hypothetical protein
MFFSSLAPVWAPFSGLTGNQTHFSLGRSGGSERGGLPLGPPPEANPLLNVVGQNTHHRAFIHFGLVAHGALLRQEV